MDQQKPSNGQAIYDSKDVSSNLKIQTSTLRKYCLLLEEEGHFFFKNDLGQRGFHDQDIIILRKMIELKNEGDMSLKNSVKAVIEWKNGNVITHPDTENRRYDERYNTIVVEFQEFRKEQRDFNEKLVNQLEKQQSYIDNKLEERDNKLMQGIRQLQETKQLELASAKEEEKKKWWEFWK